MRLPWTEMQTPLGDVALAAGERGLCIVTFRDYWDEARRAHSRRVGRPVEFHQVDELPASTVLRDYFAGNLAAIDDLEVDPAGTDFQRRVWRALRNVPVGTTTTYGRLAKEIGRPSAVRAVGAANGANPLWLVVPCHRAIGADGRLRGYAGGLERKAWLLRHEGVELTGDQLARASECRQTMLG